MKGTQVLQKTRSDAGRVRASAQKQHATDIKNILTRPMSSPLALCRCETCSLTITG